jgi:hypothetical protein
LLSYLTARPSRDVVTLARQELTREWWNSRRQRHDLFTSDVVVGEASEGDDEAARQRVNALQGIEETEHGFDDLTPCLAVVVQEQIDSDVAGTAFSLNPVTNDYDEAVIDANWGLGTSVVDGRVSPDHFVVNTVERSVVEATTEEKAVDNAQ